MVATHRIGVLPFFSNSPTFGAALRGMELISLKECHFTVTHEKRAPAVFASAPLPWASHNGGLNAGFPHMTQLIQRMNGSVYQIEIVLAHILRQQAIYFIPINVWHQFWMLIANLTDSVERPIQAHPHRHIQQRVFLNLSEPFLNLLVNVRAPVTIHLDPLKFIKFHVVMANFPLSLLHQRIE